MELLHFQVGKGPQASEVSGIVKIGQTMTMVIGVKDDENKFDMMVSQKISSDDPNFESTIKMKSKKYVIHFEITLLA